MKKSMLILAASLAVATSAFARPYGGYYHCYRRPCEVHHYHHRSHTWHGSDWGKFAAGAAFGWMANEVASTPRPAPVVYGPAPVCQAPVYLPPQVVYTPPPVIQRTTIVTPPPVIETVSTVPGATIVTHGPTSMVTRGPAPVVTIIEPETIIRTEDATTVIRRISY